ncbi:ph domain-containing protein [Stylonychia lemnae]|uniref:Ph domain-containing protein n=1 Tax=Stylonychia lemnae TaxID=5949 RepID=A0A077ZNU4_STYLE|nr:ph domain-containing protein [Stylonychia lemnae]|eukprot:CDW71588.1 ph domain-containing protein [Stylonychia lemnae]
MKSAFNMPPKSKFRPPRSPQLELTLDLQKSRHNRSQLENQSVYPLGVQDEFQQITGKEPQLKFIIGGILNQFKSFSKDQDSQMPRISIQTHQVNLKAEQQETYRSAVKRNTQDFDSITENDISFTNRHKSDNIKVSDNVDFALAAISIEDQNAKQLNQEIFKSGQDQREQIQIYNNSKLTNNNLEVGDCDFKKLPQISCVSPYKQVNLVDFPNNLSKQKQQQREKSFDLGSQNLRRKQMEFNTQIDNMRQRKYSSKKQKLISNQYLGDIERSVKIHVDHTENNLRFTSQNDLQNISYNQKFYQKSRIYANDQDSMQGSRPQSTRKAFKDRGNIDYQTLSLKQSRIQSAQMSNEDAINSSALNIPINNRINNHYMQESYQTFIKSQTQFYNDGAQREQFRIGVDSKVMRYVNRQGVPEEAKYQGSQNDQEYDQHMHTFLRNEFDRKSQMNINENDSEEEQNFNQDGKLKPRIKKLLIEFQQNRNFSSQLSNEEFDEIQQILAQKRNLLTNNCRVKAGRLKMQAENKIGFCSRKVRSFQLRHCVIKGPLFKFYQDIFNTKLDGILDFDLLTIDLAQDPENLCFKFIIYGTSKSFLFQAYNKEDYQEWTEAIAENLSKSIGKYQQQFQIVRYPKFWKNERISDNQFQYNVDSGDIMLFKGKSFTSKFNQFLQNSEYGNNYTQYQFFIDHVALLLRYSSGNVVLFEATGETGVILTDWNEFLLNNWISQYHKIVYRKLNWDRPADILIRLENFIRVIQIQSSPIQLFRLLWERNTRQKHLSFAAIDSRFKMRNLENKKLTSALNQQLQLISRWVF